MGPCYIQLLGPHVLNLRAAFIICSCRSCILQFVFVCASFGSTGQLHVDVMCVKSCVIVVVKYIFYGNALLWGYPASNTDKAFFAFISLPRVEQKWTDVILVCLSG